MYTFGFSLKIWGFCKTARSFAKCLGALRGFMKPLGLHTHIHFRSFLQIRRGLENPRGFETSVHTYTCTACFCSLQIHGLCEFHWGFVWLCIHISVFPTDKGVLSGCIQPPCLLQVFEGLCEAPMGYDGLHSQFEVLTRLTFLWRSEHFMLFPHFDFTELISRRKY